MRRRHADNTVGRTASYLPHSPRRAPGSVAPPQSRPKTILPRTTKDTHCSLRSSDLTATYLSTAGPAGRRRRGCGSSNDHARPARGEPGLYRGDAAFKLRGACHRRRYWQGWGGSLGSSPWPMASLAAGRRATLVSSRRDPGRTVFHPPTGWTVNEIPSTLGDFEPFDSQPMAEIEKVDPVPMGR